MMSNESPSSIPQNINIGYHWIVACIAVQILLLLISAVLNVREEGTIGFRMMFAILLTQTGLAAGWLVFGPGRFLLRLIAVPLWVLAASIVAGILTRPRDGLPIILGVGFTMTLVIALVLLASRWFFSVHLYRQAVLHIDRQFQFRISDLVYLMIATSVFLALGRWLVESGLDPVLDLSGPLLFIPLLGLSWAIPLIPAFFIPLSSTQKGGVVASRLLGGLLMTASIGAVGCFLLLRAMKAKAIPDFSSGYHLIEIPMAAYLLVSSSLLIIRKAGYRLGVVSRS